MQSLTFIVPFHNEEKFLEKSIKAAGAITDLNPNPAEFANNKYSNLYSGRFRPNYSHFRDLSLR